jgi:hypothetical protein
MTRYAPQWMQAPSYSASLDRGLFTALWPKGGVAAGAPITAVANTMNVSIPADSCCVPCGPATGGYLCRWNTAEVVTLTASPPSGQSRIDLIVCQVRDNQIDSGGNNDFLFNAVAGVPAASNPAVPATPTNSYPMCSVLVPGAAANLNGATITELRRLLTDTDPRWITMTPLLNGWTADASVGPPQYRRIGGLVYLRGGINGSSMNAALFTLPSGYRPALSMHFVCRATSSITLGQVQIQGPSGTILPNVSGTPSGSQFVALAGICFDADGG